MNYTEWFEAHALKHEKIVKKLLAEKYGKEEIVEYFDFDNMRKNEPDFCPLYAKNVKCHDMEHLNCYLCACPEFRFNDEGIEKKEGKTVYSYCAINSKNGQKLILKDAIHQDCSDCILPHTKTYIEKHFDIDWNKIMKRCRL
ncbi:MAG: hypothetical protein B5M52_07765 [Helicobacteraceae bacterium 4484_230]|nr:MAG: hypothetical protein B5M52_07765 [Helicobacteraceae bacterium 4484_230]